MSNPNANSDLIARRFMDSLVIEERVLGAKTPSTKTRFLGKDFETPIFAGALSHLKNGMAPHAEGAKLAGAAAFIGMGDNATFAACLDTGAEVIKIVKPYADRDEIFSRLRFAEEHGALAVGLDGGHAIQEEAPGFDTIAGYPMKLPTLDELREYIAATGLPFFLKDILSVKDALLAKELGAAGVILGHHHNLMRWAAPPVYLLPEIRKAVGEDFILIADGGIDDGFDAYKALALGADVVCTSRALMKPYMTNGAQGVADTLRGMTDQLASMMFRTSAATVKEIDPETVHKAWWL